MKLLNNKTFLRSMSVVLLVAMLIGCYGLAAGLSRQAPKAPDEQETVEQITIEALSASVVEDDETESDAQSETQETEEDTQEPDEPQEPDELQEPDERREKTPEQTKPSPDSGSGKPSTDGENGQNDDEGTGGEQGDTPLPDEEVTIVTDLSNRIITFSELEDDTLAFYAYLSGGSEEMSLRVNLRNENTSTNGTYLTSADGKNYTAGLTLGKNYFTLYIKDGGATVSRTQFIITYAADQANADRTTVGENPPTIVTSLDDGTTQVSNRNYTLEVTARTYTGEIIYASNILVKMDGTTISNPTGSGTYEYQLYFDTPNVGDEEDHEITVLAWDNEGNSRFVSYTLTYQFTDSGDTIGTAYVVFDATTVGLGILDTTYAYEIKQDEPASYAVLAALEEYGYTATYEGTPDLGFKLERISRGDMARNANVPEELWQCVVADGLTQTGQRSRDSLGEFDYTSGSGWLYSVNGGGYAGKGLSNYYLSNGDTIYMRFTLAYGKDIAGSGIGGYGALSHYCGVWINGGASVTHSYDEGQITTEPTCHAEGEKTYTCQVCKWEKTETLPKTEHQYIETSRVEPTCSAEGSVTQTCQICGETTTQTLPKTEHHFVETSRVEPTCNAEGSVTQTCQTCGTTSTQTLARLEHNYVESSHVDPTETTPGYTEWTCSHCGDIKHEDLPALGGGGGQEEENGTGT